MDAMRLEESNGTRMDGWMDGWMDGYMRTILPGWVLSAASYITLFKLA